jgi:hypothetical protein
MRYCFNTTVRKIEQRKLGWFILLEGSWESLYIGDERPQLEVGQRVVVTIEGVPHEPGPGNARAFLASSTIHYLHKRQSCVRRSTHGRHSYQTR